MASRIPDDNHSCFKILDCFALALALFLIIAFLLFLIFELKVPWIYDLWTTCVSIVLDGSYNFVPGFLICKVPNNFSYFVPNICVSGSLIGAQLVLPLFLIITDPFFSKYMCFRFLGASIAPYYRCYFVPNLCASGSLIGALVLALFLIIAVLTLLIGK